MSGAGQTGAMVIRAADRVPARIAPGTAPSVGVAGVGALGDAELLAVAVSRPLSVSSAALERVEGAAALVAASPAELVRAGLPLRRSVGLACAFELARRAITALPAEGWVIRRPADLAERLVPGMGLLEREELRVAVLNTKNTVTALCTVYAGSVAGTSVRVGEVFREAVRRNGAAVVVAHNHPSGDPTPSPEDLRITTELAEAGRLLDIALLDHLVIGRGRWVSLRALGAL
jgi:DNA repair protein RadC